MSWLEDFTAVSERKLPDRARDALNARGVTDEQITLYRLGYIDNDLPELEYPTTFVEWAKTKAKLDDAFVLPLTNTLGEVKGFQFRHVERERSGYSDFITDKSEAVLFGLAQAVPHIWKTRSVFLVEGAFDLFPIQRFVPATVATLTARVVASLVRVLRRVADHVWVGYDMDEPGRKGCERFQRQHGADFISVSTVAYPKVQRLDGKGLIKDPNELWESWGDSKLSDFLRSTIHLPDPQMETFHAEGLRTR